MEEHKDGGQDPESLQVDERCACCCCCIDSDIILGRKEGIREGEDEDGGVIADVDLVEVDDNVDLRGLDEDDDGRCAC